MWWSGDKNDCNETTILSSVNLIDVVRSYTEQEKLYSVPALNYKLMDTDDGHVTDRNERNRETTTKAIKENRRYTRERAKK